MYVVECGDITGSAIKITQEGTLTLCEVEVLGRFNLNVALLKF